MTYTLVDKKNTNLLLHRSELLHTAFNTVCPDCLKRLGIEETEYQSTISECSGIFQRVSQRYRIIRASCVTLAALSIMSILLGATSAGSLVWVPDMSAKVLGVTLFSIIAIIGALMLLFVGITYLLTRNHLVRRAIIAKITKHLENENQTKYYTQGIRFEFKYMACLSSWYNGAKVQYTPVIDVCSYDVGYALGAV